MKVRLSFDMFKQGNINGSFIFADQEKITWSIFGTFKCFDCDMFWICAFLVVSLD